MKQTFVILLLAVLAATFVLSGCDKPQEVEEAKILIREKAVTKQAKELEEQAKNPSPTPSESVTPSPTGEEEPDDESTAPSTAGDLVDQVEPIDTPTPEPTVELSAIEAALEDVLLSDQGSSSSSDSSADQPERKYYSNDGSEEPADRESAATGSQLKDLLGGVVTRTTPPQLAETDSAQADQKSTKSSAPVVIDPNAFVTGQARGYVMLQAMQPQARRSVDRMVQILLDARIRQIYLGVLMDGTFGRDLNYLSLILRRLSFEDREITLVLYLTNGATMRDFENTDIHEGFNKINPSYFRELIRFDPGTQQRFRSMARNAKPIFELNKNLNPNNRNVAIVMLEDNLDYESYKSMRALAAQELGTLATFVRNPCPGCFPGNDQFAGEDKVELHRPSELNALHSGDGFTMDGNGIRFAREGGFGVSLSETESLLDRSVERGLDYFGLWRAERQGLSPSVGSGERAHPEDRVYEIPSPAQAEIEIKLLRRDLRQEERS